MTSRDLWFKIMGLGLMFLGLAVSSAQGRLNQAQMEDYIDEKIDEKLNEKQEEA